MADYATITDVTALGVPAKAIAAIPPDTVDAVLRAASRKVDSYVGSRFQLPLVKWDASVTEAAARIAAYWLLAGRGFQPGSADAEQLRQGYTDAIDWLKDVANGKAIPSVVETIDSAAPPIDPQNAPFVLQGNVSSSSGMFSVSGPTRRGW